MGKARRPGGTPKPKRNTSRAAIGAAVSIAHLASFSMFCFLSDYIHAWRPETWTLAADIMAGNRGPVKFAKVQGDQACLCVRQRSSCLLPTNNLSPIFVSQLSMTVPG